MKRRILSLTLALCMMIGFCIPAWATQSTTSDQGKLTTTVTGTVAEPQIKVTLPTTLAFSIDPTIDATTGTGLQQVTAGSEFNVLNNSAVDVYLSVSALTASNVSLTYEISRIDNSSYSNYFLFSIYPKGDSFTWSEKSILCVYTQSDFLAPISKKGSPIAKTTETNISNGATFCIAARVGSNFKLEPESTFSLNVTFVVSRDFIATDVPGSDFPV